MMEFENNKSFLKKSEALFYVELLSDTAILSKKGKELFIEKLKEEDLLTRTKILYLLVNFFQNDFEYRTGLNMYESLLEKREEGNIIDVEKEFEKKYFNSKAYKIEAEIENEEVTYDVEMVFSLDEIPSIQLDETNIIHPKRSVLGKTITRTLFDLQIIGLIDDTVLNEVLSNIDNEQLFIESAVIDYAAKKLNEKENYGSEYLKQQEILKRLKIEKFMTEETYAALSSSYKKNKLKSIFEVLDSCENVLKWSSPVYYEKEVLINQYFTIFKELSKVVDGFIIEEYSVKIRNEKEDSFELVFHFKVDGHFYGTVIPVFIYSGGYKLNLFSQFLDPVNKFLKEKNREELCLATQNYNQQTEQIDFYFLSINYKQRELLELWEYKNHFDFIGGEGFDRVFSPSKTQKGIILLEEIGFFDQLTKDEIRMGIRNCIENTVSSLEEIISYFPNTMFCFPEIMTDLERPYEEEVLRFFDFLGTDYFPEHILDTFTNQELESLFSFELDGIKYSRLNKVEEDYFDMGYRSLIINSIKGLGINLICFDKIFYLKLSDSQIEKLKVEYPEFCERLTKI